MRAFLGFPPGQRFVSVLAMPVHAEVFCPFETNLVIIREPIRSINLKWCLMICYKIPLLTNQTLCCFAGECKWCEQSPPQLLFPLALQLWQGQWYKFLHVPICRVITALMTAVLTRRGHLSVSCLTFLGAQLQMTHQVSQGAVACPTGLPAPDPCSLCDALQRSRALSIRQAQHCRLVMGHTSVTHSAKIPEAVPPVSSQPSQVSPGLLFLGVGSPPSMNSSKKLSPLLLLCTWWVPCRTKGCAPKTACRGVV